MAKSRKKPKRTEPKVHKDLKGFDIKVNESGEIESSFDIDQINEFLNKNVPDKKLKYRDDLDVARDEDYVPGQGNPDDEEEYVIEQNSSQDEEDEDILKDELKEDEESSKE